MARIKNAKWFDGDSKGMPDPETSVQGEITASRLANGCALAFGVVVECEDPSKSGKIKVLSQLFGDKAVQCDYVSPIGGAGYGLVAVPGIGATVLVGNSPFSDPPCNAFWMGVLYAPGQEDLPSIRSQPYKNEIKSRAEVKDNGRVPDAVVSHGIPNMDEVYQDNNLPDSFVLKHPAGHSISLSEKSTEERTINEIKLKTAGNKRMIMSDAPPSAGGESILLVDENRNLIKITSLSDDNPDSVVTEAGKNIETTSFEGNIEHVIGPRSSGNYTIQNVGTGNISIDSNQGNITLDAAKSITLKCGNSTITITPNGINIDAANLNITGSNGDVSVRGTTLRTHRHSDPDIYGGTTTPPV